MNHCREMVANMNKELYYKLRSVKKDKGGTSAIQIGRATFPPAATFQSSYPFER